MSKDDTGAEDIFRVAIVLRGACLQLCVRIRGRQRIF